MYVYAIYMYTLYIYIHIIYAAKPYSALKNEDILPFVTTWVDLEGIMLSEMNLRGKDKCCMISLTCEI